MTPPPGQRTLFGDARRPKPSRYRVTVSGQRRSWSVALPLVVAEARAAALAGRRAVVLATDGSGVEVRHSAESGFTVTTAGMSTPPWSDQVRRLLDEHG